MKYYKVKPQYDNKTRYKRNNHHQSIPNSILIENELYTPHEFSQLTNCPAWFDIVEISKKKIYWCFGARFAVHNEEVAQ